MSLVSKFKRHLETGRPTQLGNPTLQTWWVIEKSMESPESDRVFCDVVGVLREQEKDLKKPYRQTKVLVLTESIHSRKGIALDWKTQFSIGKHHEIALSPTDYAHEVFPGWD